MVVLSSPPYMVALHLQKMSAARERNMSQVKQEQKKKRQLLPGKNKKEVAYYAWKHDIPEAR